MLKRSSFNNGFTLIELMIVIAIVSVVAALSIAAIRKNAAHNAMTTLSNEMKSAFTTQRTRALTTGRASYVVVNTANGGTVDLYMGGDSHCSGNDGAHIDIVYADDTPLNRSRMGIDLAVGANGNHRSLSKPNDDTYYAGNMPMMRITGELRSVRIANNVVAKYSAIAVADGRLTACFQPNGQTVFFTGNVRQQNANSAVFTIASTNDSEFVVGGTSQIIVEQFGNIRAQYVAN